MPDRLKGKVAIVTGGSAGIGKAIAETFAAEGAQVAICGRRRAKLDETLHDIKAAGGEAIAIQCNVSEESQVQELVRTTVEEFGRLDVLVNNAGTFGGRDTIETLGQEEWDHIFNVDAKGSWLCSKYAVPEIRKAGGGSIIMISSISAYIGQPEQGAYNAAKGAQECLMKCMALDFARDKIRVNSVCPAWVRSEINKEDLARMEAEPDKVFPPGISYKDLLKMHPIGRLGEGQDVAWAAVYLASDESTWVTGSSLMVDGGYTCQ